MSRRRLLIVGIALFVTAVVAAVSLTAASQDRRHRQDTSSPAYVTVTAVSNPEPSAALAGRVAVPSRRGPGSSLPETVTLVVVGTMLIGLAAAVRRTT